MLAIDMACRKQMIAIEFDGPSHFLREVGSGKVLEVENGATRAKRRFLERLGWKVVNIRYFDWAKAKSKKAKRAFVSEMLKEVVG
jgi:very-short-patch-repair endonuclease